MTDHVYLNADRTKVVGEFSKEAKFQVSREEAKKLGLVPQEDPEPQKRRVQQRRVRK